MQIKHLFIALGLIMVIGINDANAKPVQHRKSGVSLVDKIRYKIRKRNCNLSQSARSAKLTSYGNYDRRPHGHWPIEFLQ